MTADMEHLIRNDPVIESHGSYILNAHYGQGIPVVTVTCADDGHRAVHMCINRARASITLVPSLVCKTTDNIWDTVVGLMRECGTYDERNRLVKFESDEAVLRGLDHFFELLEKL